MNKRRILFSIFLTFLANVLAIPLWTKCGYGSFVQTLFNKEARLEFVYTGEVTGDKPFHFQSTPNPFYSSWYYGREDDVHRACADLCYKAGGKWQKLSFLLNARHDGEVKMLIKGSSTQDEYGYNYPILTDWRNIKINGEVISSTSETVSNEKPFCKRIHIKKGEHLRIEAEFRKHRFTIHDFIFLEHGSLWFLITGNLLIIFLIYRLLSCLAERRERLRPSDTLLLVFFFPCLFLPMINISDAVKSVRENRMLATKPKLGEILRGGVNTGGGYEKWFNDHFCGRVALIKLHDVFRNKISKIVRTKRALYFKENGWEFFCPIVQGWDYRSIFMQSIVHNLAQLNRFCQQNRIKLYVLEVPRKEGVYKQLLSDKYGFDSKEFIKVSQAQENIRKEVRKHHIPYVYPYEALSSAAQQDFVFFKWKHHWTDWGAFVGYRELMKEINKDFPNMPVVSLDDYCEVSSWLIRDEYERKYNLGWHLYQFFNNEGQDDPPNRTLYNYYDHKNGDKMSIKVGKFTKDFAYPEGKHKIMLIGTSQNENFLQFLPYSATQTKYIRLNMNQVKEMDQYKVLKFYRKDILAFKPDILILSISTEDLPRLRNLCSIK